MKRFRCSCGSEYFYGVPLYFFNEKEVVGDKVANPHKLIFNIYICLKCGKKSLPYVDVFNANKEQLDILLQVEQTLQEQS